MGSPILLLFTNPDGFFRRDPKEWENLRIPAVIVLAAGIAGAVSAYFVSQTLLRLFPGELQAASGLVSAFGVGGALAGVFIGWVVYTAVFYAISLVFMGKGPFTRTLSAVGYGFLPTIIGGLIDVAFYWSSLPGLQVSPVKDVTEIQSATLGLTHSPVFQMTAIIGIIFLLWSASIWTFGIRYAREISLRQAAITVAVPVVVMILVSLVTSGVFG